MIAIIFEVWPADGRREEYLGIAASLRDDLSRIPGFVSIERFESLTTPGKMLSLSIFEDEDAVMAWRRTARHRAAQDAGRSRVFSDYRLRVAGIIRDYGMTDRSEAPDDSRAHFDAIAHG